MSFFYIKAFIYVLYKNLVDWLTADRQVYKNKSQHIQDVFDVSKQMTCRNDKRVSLLRDNADTHCTRRQTYKNGLHLIDIRKLNKIISIDTERMTIEVEPLCTMEVIARELLNKGCMLMATPEFKGITIGGTIAGGGLESSSFRYGMVQSSVIEYDLVLGNGVIQTTSPDMCADLFYGAMWTMGTVGLVTRIKAKIIPCKPYVRLKYDYHSNADEYIKQLKRDTQVNSSHDFVEGLQLTRGSFVVIRGYLYSEPMNIFSMSWWFSKWFIQHILEDKPTTEYMRTLEYIHRWDRGIYWLGYIKMNPTFFKRFLFGWMFDMRTHHLISRLKDDKTSESSRIVCDVGPPLYRLKEMIEYTDEHIGVYPQWHEPARLFRNEHHILACEAICDPADDLIVDVGIYGVPYNTDGSKRAFKAYDINKGLETKVRELRGGKGFFSPCMYTEKEFGEIFDMERYNNLREKYSATQAFPNIMEKILYKI